MRKAIITHSRPAVFGGEGVDTFTTVVEDEDISMFHAKVAGVVAGLVGGSNVLNNSIVGIEMLEEV